MRTGWVASAVLVAAAGCADFNAAFEECREAGTCRDGTDDAGGGGGGGGEDAGADAGQPDGGSSDGGALDAGTDGGFVQGHFELGVLPPLQAFRCLTATVTRKDGGTNLLDSSSRSVRLDAGAEHGIYSDVGCTIATNSVTIAPGDPGALFYFVPNRSGQVTVSMSAPGWQPSQGLVQVGSPMRSGNETIGGANASRIFNIVPPHVDITKTLLIFQSTSPRDTPEDSSVRCRLLNDSQLQCERRVANLPVEIHWQTLEHRAFHVQHLVGTCPYDGGPANFTVVAPQQFDATRAFHLRSYESGGSTYSGDDFFSSRLVDGGIHFSSTETCGPQTPQTVAVQIVEIEGANALHGTVVMADGGTMASSSPLAQADVASTFLLHSHQVEAVGAAGCGYTLYGETNATVVSFLRGPCPVANRPLFPEIAWSRVDLANRAVVTRVQANLPLGQFGTTVNSAYDPDRTLVFASSQTLHGQSGGQAANTTNTALPESTARFWLFAGNLVVQRAGNRAPGTWTVYLVQFER